MAVYLKFLSYGFYEIEVHLDFKVIKKFNTTDMQIVDDVQEYKKDDGFEDNLQHFDTFREVEEWLLN